MRVSDSKRCFVISPIDQPESEIRKRSDMLLKHIIEPVLNDLSYSHVRADSISEQGLITKQVIDNLINMNLVIADLTGHNPNVFYELAIRHATRKPVVQLIRKGEKIPFDVHDSRTIYYDLDLDSAANAKSELKKMILSTKESDLIDTPISEAILLQNLKESNDPERKSLGEIVETISSLQNQINRLDSTVRDEQKEIRYYLEKYLIDGKYSFNERNREKEIQKKELASYVKFLKLKLFDMSQRDGKVDVKSSITEISDALERILLMLSET